MPAPAAPAAAAAAAAAAPAPAAASQAATQPGRRAGGRAHQRREAQQAHELPALARHRLLDHAEVGHLLEQVHDHKVAQQVAAQQEGERLARHGGEPGDDGAEREAVHGAGADGQHHARQHQHDAQHEGGEEGVEAAGGVRLDVLQQQLQLLDVEVAAGHQAGGEEAAEQRELEHRQAAAAGAAAGAAALGQQAVILAAGGAGVVHARRAGHPCLEAGAQLLQQRPSGAQRQQGDQPLLCAAAVEHVPEEAAAADRAGQRQVGPAAGREGGSAEMRGRQRAGGRRWRGAQEPGAMGGSRQALRGLSPRGQGAGAAGPRAANGGTRAPRTRWVTGVPAPRAWGPSAIPPLDGGARDAGQRPAQRLDLGLLLWAAVERGSGGDSGQVSRASNRSAKPGARQTCMSPSAARSRGAVRDRRGGGCARAAAVKNVLSTIVPGAAFAPARRDALPALRPEHAGQRGMMRVNYSKRCGCCGRRCGVNGWSGASGAGRACTDRAFEP